MSSGGQLAERAQKVSDQMGEIGKESPIFGPEHEQQIEGAGRAMKRVLTTSTSPRPTLSFASRLTGKRYWT